MCDSHSSGPEYSVPLGLVLSCDEHVAINVEHVKTTQPCSDLETSGIKSEQQYTTGHYWGDGPKGNSSLR